MHWRALLLIRKKTLRDALCERKTVFLLLLTLLLWQSLVTRGSYEWRIKQHQHHDDTHNYNSGNIDNVTKLVTTTSFNGRQQQLRKSPRASWKRILLWTPYFGKYKNWRKVFRRMLEGSCPESRCSIYADRAQVYKADAILFNANDLQKKIQSVLESPFLFPPQEERLPNQVYVYMTFEPPTNMENIQIDQFRNFFNWTMTYRSDADVSAPYGRYYASPNGVPNRTELPDEAFRKKKFAMMMASHCKTWSKREGFLEEMQKYAQVDYYGKCGPLKCGQPTTLPLLTPGMTDPCEVVFKEYLFYLALENSICKDYVTEKFFRALKLGIVPVVLGGANYSHLAPPHSYIDALDFENVEQLTKYMKKVSKDYRLYKKYLSWQSSFDIELGHPYNPFTCDLCMKLHQLKTNDGHVPKKVYSDIKAWNFNTSTCFKWKP